MLQMTSITLLLNLPVILSRLLRRTQQLHGLLALTSIQFISGPRWRHGLRCGGCRHLSGPSRLSVRFSCRPSFRFESLHTDVSEPSKSHSNFFAVLGEELCSHRVLWMGLLLNWLELVFWPQGFEMTMLLCTRSTTACNCWPTISAFQLQLFTATAAAYC